MVMNKIVAYPKIATPVARAMPKEAPLAASLTNLVPENHAARMAKRATHPRTMGAAWRTGVARTTTEKR